MQVNVLLLSGYCFVNYLDRLVGNLCTIWIGRFHLHANVARFERANKPVKPSGPSQSNVHGTFGLFVSAARDFPPLIASGDSLMTCCLGWTSARFVESVYTSDDESKHGARILNDGAQNSDVESDDECNVDGVSETVFSDNVDECNVDGHDGPPNGEDMVNMPRVDS
ncbi:hypothetical protein Tco_0313552 [Tanacetum coccineum]